MGVECSGFWVAINLLSFHLKNEYLYFIHIYINLTILSRLSPGDT